MGRQVHPHCPELSFLGSSLENFTSSYLLAAAAVGPLNGILANTLGRKQVLYPVVLVFLVSP